MTDETTVLFTISLDSSVEDDERLKFSQKLLPELRSLDEVIKADRAEDLNPEARSKVGFATLLGVLQAEVSVKNIKAFFGFLAERLADKPIKIRAKVGDKEVEIEAKSEQELEEAEKRVLNLIEKLSG